MGMVGTVGMAGCARRGSVLCRGHVNQSSVCYDLTVNNGMLSVRVPLSYHPTLSNAPTSSSVGSVTAGCVVKQWEAGTNIMRPLRLHFCDPFPLVALQAAPVMWSFRERPTML